jgi:hypothetical protein
MFCYFRITVCQFRNLSFLESNICCFPVQRKTSFYITNRSSDGGNLNCYEHNCCCLKAWCPICCKTGILHFEIIKTEHVFYSYSIKYTFHIFRKKHLETFRKRKVNSTSDHVLTFSAPKYCPTALHFIQNLIVCIGTVHV